MSRFVYPYLYEYFLVYACAPLNGARKLDVAENRKNNFTHIFMFEIGKRMMTTSGDVMTMIQLGWSDYLIRSPSYTQT